MLVETEERKESVGRRASGGGGEGVERERV